MRRADVPLLVLLAALAAAFALENASYFANLVVHGLVDVFAVGRSLAKVHAFLLYAAILCVLALLPRATRFLAALRVPTRLLLGALGASFAYGLALTLAFFARYGFSLRELVIAFSNGELSTTMILHTHVTKGFVALPLALFGIAGQENADTGGAFLGLLPDAAFLVGLVLAVSCGALLVLKFAELVRARTSRRAAFVLLYAIVSFTALKNMLDGGILNPETPLALAGLLLVLAYGERGRPRFSPWLCALPVAGYAAAAGALVQARVIPLAVLSEFAYPAAAFALLILALLLWTRPERRLLAPALVASVAAAALLSFSVLAAANTYANALRVPAAEGAVLALYHEPAPASAAAGAWQEEERFNDLRVYRFAPHGQTRILDLMRDNRLRRAYLPIEVPGTTCTPGTPYALDVVVASAVPPRPGPDPGRHYAAVTGIRPLSRDGRYQVTVRLDSCAPRVLNLLGELVAERTPEPFFITSISVPYAPAP